ncbi:hypothetical protein K439DRAFT_1357759, partial [Ramaria rubella]
MSGSNKLLTLSADNWLEWSMQMEVSLIVKDLWDVVSGIKTGGAIVWNSLCSIHIACSLGSHMALMCHFFTIHKDGDQSMHEWVASVQHTAWKLGEVGATTFQEHIILILISGLNNDYIPLIISFNSPPPCQLTVEYVVQQLLNDES